MDYIFYLNLINKFVTYTILKNTLCDQQKGHAAFRLHKKQINNLLVIYKQVLPFPVCINS